MKMHLYLNGVYVGKIRIRADEKPSENIYVVHFWFKKQIFYSNHVKCVIHPTKLLYTQNNITHRAFEYEKGIEV
jgi:hypothetical protein